MNLGAKKALLSLATFLLFALSSIAASTTNNVTPIEREVKQVMDDTRKAMTQLESDFQSKDETVQQQAIKKYQELQKDAADKLLALSKKDPKDPGTVDALIMVVYSARNGDAANEALDRLKRDYLQSSHIAPLCSYLERDSADGPKTLKKIAETNPDPNVKAAALLGLARSVKESNPEKAKKMLREVISKYPDAKTAFFGHKVNLGEDAKNELFEMENLAIGKQAPEITGEDVDGKKFSLSDYRGKVVLLDFWGDW